MILKIRNISQFNFPEIIKCWSRDLWEDVSETLYLDNLPVNCISLGSSGVYSVPATWRDGEIEINWNFKFSEIYINEAAEDKSDDKSRSMFPLKLDILRIIVWIQPLTLYSCHKHKSDKDVRNKGPSSLKHVKCWSLREGLN